MLAEMVFEIQKRMSNVTMEITTLVMAVHQIVYLRKDLFVEVEMIQHLIFVMNDLL